MKIGMVGLGRMGGNMTVRLIRYGHEVVAYDPNESARDAAAPAGAKPAATLEELVNGLEPPRIVWLMIPAGRITDATIEALTPLLSEGDTVIDGGHSHSKDSNRPAQTLDTQ